ncbi:hypothetical protein Verru16b_03578 [Lacunisphaera limnophila]|uniref:Lactonase, 7-bladed beta-propeller n=1 Tax=Lacunisphaera limnophila TaxID=1838286 RepID=A0A1D8B003_9BACT|nr:hypothetical protein [Lacunisphaera limnophila]AOS46472.1 hypothetical protein Verru16b_03578 [Lacunisphaera limnophila]
MHRALPIRFPALAIALLAAAGCATPGPNHLYTISSAHSGVIRDTGPAETVEVPSFITADEVLTGLAYDPYTDHLFLRLAPGNRIRVIDRPDRSIKREFTIPELASMGGGDLAVRPRDGHLFFTCPVENFVIETDRFGKFIRRLELEGSNGWTLAIAYDPVRNRLLLATSGAYAALRIHDLDGKLLRTADFPFRRTTSLAYDADKRELHAAVLGEPGVVVLDEQGQLLRKAPAGDPFDFIDLGQRSFVRVF